MSDSAAKGAMTVAYEDRGRLFQALRERDAVFDWPALLPPYREDAQHHLTLVYERDLYLRLTAPWLSRRLARRRALPTREAMLGRFALRTPEPITYAAQPATEAAGVTWLDVYRWSPGEFVSAPAIDYRPRHELVAQLERMRGSPYLLEAFEETRLVSARPAIDWPERTFSYVGRISLDDTNEAALLSERQATIQLELDALAREMRGPFDRAIALLRDQVIQDAIARDEEDERRRLSAASKPT